MIPLKYLRTRVLFSKRNYASAPLTLAFKTVTPPDYPLTNEKPNALFLHGLFGSGNNWRSIGQKVASRMLVNVRLVDCRNHGESPHHPDMDYEVMAQDLKSLIETNSFGSVYLIGHSMGGKMAMNFAIKYPNLVRKLVVVDISPIGYRSSEHVNIAQALSDIPLSTIKERKEADQYLSQSVQDPFVRSFLLQNLIRVEDGTYKWRLNIDSIKKNMKKLMGSVDGIFLPDTLFIKGTDSSYILDADYDVIMRMFPKCEIKEVRGSHYPHAENPQEFSDVLISFLRK
eukprot:TRINITY_DN1640_c0_g1_i1.p1 TRINITY_DN1640_c0_g1~~TRINITY_DN1640_c0_g1_i1.p1  ORF type:complete len:285 (-),score=25.82 TRINITY_DN1640_c0_g1_i1:169-1023(-)